MNKVLGFLQINAIALLLFCVAFFFFKDYFGRPHQRVTVESLAHTTGPMKYLSSTMSLPSGYQTGYWLMLENPRRDFNVPLGLSYRDATDDLHEGAEVTVGYSPEVDPATSTAAAFSLKRGDKEYLSPESLVRSYNGALDKQLRNGILCAAGGFVALGLVWLVRRWLAARKAA